MSTKKASTIVVLLIALGLIAPASRASYTAEPGVRFRTLGAASEAVHLIRPSVADSRIDHDSLFGTVTRTASERRSNGRLPTSAHDTKSVFELEPSPERFGTVTRTASERRSKGRLPTSAHNTRSVFESELSPERFTTVARTPGERRSRATV